MLFYSYIFVVCFLPLVIIGYYLLARMTKGTARYLYLLLMSLWFYAYFNIKYLPLVLISVIANFCISKAMQEVSKEKWQKLLLILGLIVDVGLLFYYKYCNFFIDNINGILDTNYIMEKLILPLGISFSTINRGSYCYA